MHTNRKEENEEIPNIERQDWSVKEIADESTNKPSDEILREVLRGDESRGDADKRDIVGGPDSSDTPQGREEAKNDKGRDD